MVITGLERLLNDSDLINKFKGNIAYLCHSASINNHYVHGLEKMKSIFGDRLKKVFGPQHGFVTDVQDNMIETSHQTHSFFNLPIYSLYSETRTPTDEMLDGLDIIFVDLQDIGARVYTYIYTTTLLMDACAKKGIKVVILDRPNPINGETIQGNILDIDYASFVGLHPIAARHGLTIGEVAKMHKKYWAQAECDLEVIELTNWKRNMWFDQTGLPWVPPSPNIPTIESCYSFPGTVLFEGTMISEGRGTTRPLELIGHPDIEPFSFYHDVLKDKLKETNLTGFILRPLVFQPTFQKHGGTPCGGIQIHVTNRKEYNPWELGQFLLKETFHFLGEDFQWKRPPYEYDNENMPIDIINGTPLIREWVQKNESIDQLRELCNFNLDKYLSQREEILIYK